MMEDMNHSHFFVCSSVISLTVYRISCSICIWMTGSKGGNKNHMMQECEILSIPKDGEKRNEQMEWIVVLKIIQDELLNTHSTGLDNSQTKMSFHVRIADYFFVATVSVDSRQ